MNTSHAVDLYHEFAAAVAYVAITDCNGDASTGTAFHIGDNIWITARHVVEGNTIDKIATTDRSIPAYTDTFLEGALAVDGTLFSWPGIYHVVGEPMLHPDKDVDVAALRLEGPFTELLGDTRAIPRSCPVPVVQLGGWLDGAIDNQLMLAPVLVMGYPSIPRSNGPRLVASRAEVSAVVDKYTGGHPHFILSAMARPGLSGSLALTHTAVALGVATESLLLDYKPAETGYFAVLSLEPIYDCLKCHDIIPDAQEFAKTMRK